MREVATRRRACALCRVLREGESEGRAGCCEALRGSMGVCQTGSEPEVLKCDTAIALEAAARIAQEAAPRNRGGLGYTQALK